MITLYTEESAQSDNSMFYFSFSYISLAELVSLTVKRIKNIVINHEDIWELCIPLYILQCLYVQLYILAFIGWIVVFPGSTECVISNTALTLICL